jgi:hypothetical protein
MRKTNTLRFHCSYRVINAQTKRYREGKESDLGKEKELLLS